MGETMEFAIGNEVRCGDGVCGELRRLVLDPSVGTLTRLVVEPRHQGGAVRLMSIELVDPPHRGIQLRCTIPAYKDSGTSEAAAESPSECPG